MQYDFFDPFSWHKKMRAESPVFYDKDFIHFIGGTGTWHILRYDDVQKVLSDFENFSNEFIPKTAENPISQSLSINDPPRHKQLRSLVSKAFTPKAINDMKPWIEQITNELLDEVADRGEMDITRDIAIPVPIQVIARLMGIPYEDKDKFKKWSIMILQQPSEAEGGEEGFHQSQVEMAGYFLQMFEQRRENPGDDLISQLVQAEVDGEKLNTQELLGFCILLLVAGNDTTANLINNAMLTLIENPEVQEHLRSHPEDISKALEEVLRYRAPVQYINRIATKDVELRGQSIKKGDLINVWMGSANRDETVFPDPDKFDIHRTNLKHVSFSHGIHFCLGAPLARLEANIVLKVIIERLHQFKLKNETEPVKMNPSSFAYSIKELPVVFKKR